MKFPILASVAMFTLGSVQGAVTAGDLMLFFQKGGDGDTVYVNLGDAATLYRGVASGISGADYLLSRVNFININSTLTTAFGAGWAADGDIFAGLAGVYTNSTNTTVVNGDQYRTIYVSRARGAVGTVGTSGSTAYNLFSTGSLTTSANGIAGLTTNFATQLGSADEGVVTVALSQIDNQVVIGAGPAYNQGTAFGQFTTGVSQRGSASAFGTFSDAGQVEFALDLQRLSPDGTQYPYEVLGASRIGTYEGTVTIGTNGDVSFFTIPEPSSVTLAGLAGLALAFRRRRNA